ncbi:hypothetical protein [Streptomyces decoyicus]|uniref:hypothetical protein n=1 Tax=Streptomyces decoyicus TaxID=249567 RepID=UPI0038636C75
MIRRLSVSSSSSRVRGQFLDPGPGLLGLFAQRLLARVDLFQDGVELRVVGHASRQVGVVV